MHPADPPTPAAVRQVPGLAASAKERAAQVLEYRTRSCAPRCSGDDREQAAALVTEMNPDERADVPESSTRRGRKRSSRRCRRARRETAAPPHDPTRGRTDDDRVRLVEASTTVEEALRRAGVIAWSEKREAMHAIYTIDEEGRLAGVLSLRERPRPRRDARRRRVTELGRPLTADREEVARVSRTTTSSSGRERIGHVMGVITVDDVTDAIEEEQTETW
jgi:magnesium transporter